MTGATSGGGTFLLFRTDNRHEFTSGFGFLRFAQYLFSVYSFVDN
jgi:hypothetical protein